MKTPFLFFLILSLLTVGLTGIAYLLIHQNPSESSEWIELQREVGTNQASGRFRSVESELDYRLTYGWEDFHTQTLLVSFSITKSSLQKADDEFGYYPDELEIYIDQSLASLRLEMIIHLKKVTQKLIKQSKYSEYLSIAEDNPDSFNLRLSAPPSLHREVKAEFRRITKEIAKHQSVYFKKIDREKQKQKKAFLSAWGLRYIGDKIGVNYGLLARNNQKRLEKVFLNFKNISTGKNLHQFLSVLLSFIQEVRYGIPPLTENGKYILGFWVPPKVLVNNFGDCDSKGVTFASLWLNFRNYPILLVKVPDHLFVALAIPSFNSGGIVINGLRYTLCEVTGPDKIPPGILTPYSRLYLEGGNYSYELIQ